MKQFNRNVSTFRTDKFFTIIIKLNRNKTAQSYFGALNAKTKKHHLIEMAWQDTENIIEALKKLSRIYPNKKLCILWDNARWHKSKELRKLLRKGEIFEHIHLINFPPYAPDENPEEHVWKYGKEKIANKHFESFDKLKETFTKTLKTRTFGYSI